MHPITIIEILIALGIAAGFLVLAFILPKKFRRVGMYVVLAAALAELAFFTIRPIWIDYHLGIKIEQQNEYLEDKYPEEEWEVRTRTSRSYNPYHLEVHFANEKGWVYAYRVDGDKIKQVSVGVPDDQFYESGLHYEDLGE